MPKKNKIICLGVIGSDATLHKGCAVEVFQKYLLKLTSFIRWPELISNGIQNVKNAKMINITTGISNNLFPHVLPSINSAGFSTIPSLQ